MQNNIVIIMEDREEILTRIYQFSERFSTVNIYNSHQISAPLGYNRFELVAGFGVINELKGSFKSIAKQIDASEQWIFGRMNYEAKDEFISDKDSNETYFYVPEIIFTIQKNELTIINNGINNSLFNQYVEEFKALQLPKEQSINLNYSVEFKSYVSKEKYLDYIKQIKQDILNGAYYEMNYCQKFDANIALKNEEILDLHKKMMRQSPAPFSAYLKFNKMKILCASPERFLMRDGNKLVSQPIKGTNKRLEGVGNLQQLNNLRESEKELAENVMIVDLVRNDLTKVCKTGTIKVEELCGTYAFSKVNQMISTVAGQLKENISFFEIMEALFPMGSMTGAPKIEVIKNIKLFEQLERGIYSGCIGYIMPNNDFDFNVVIRTLVVEESNIHFHVGGAITFDSTPEMEYEECLLKGRSITDLFI